MVEFLKRKYNTLLWEGWGEGEEKDHVIYSRSTIRCVKDNKRGWRGDGEGVH